MLHRRDGARFSPDVMQRVSHGLRVFRYLLANSKWLSCAFYCGVASVWPLYHKGLIGGVLQRWLSFWKVLPSPQRNSRVLSEWPFGSWSPHWPLTKALLPRFLSLAGWPALGRVLVGPNFIHLRMREAIVFLGTFNVAELFLYWTSTLQLFLLPRPPCQ